MPSYSSSGPSPGRADAIISEIARAKINLTLRIIGRRSDGYHELDSLVAFADFGDVVSLTVGAPIGVTVDGPFASRIVGENLLRRALYHLADIQPALRLGSVRLEKNIPVAAGLGGGSADAAALLRAVRRANPEHKSHVDWLALAARLGADVPVCLAGEATRMSGIGEKLQPVDRLPRVAAVLVMPDVMPPADKTRQVFAKLAAPAAIATQTSAPPALRFKDPEAVLAFVAAHGNDLAGAAQAIMPGVRQAEHALAAQAGCRIARMSGAGPSCFGLFATHDEATMAARALSLAHPDWWIRQVKLG